MARLDALHAAALARRREDICSLRGLWTTKYSKRIKEKKNGEVDLLSLPALKP
jgi:hypothetical protein